MGCYPIGKILSKAITKCNGGEERRSISPVYNVTYSPPRIYETRTMAKTVTFSENNSVYIIPNEPAQNPNIHEAQMTQPEQTGPSPTQSEVQKPKNPVPVKGRVRRHGHETDSQGLKQSEPVQHNGGVRIVHGPHPRGFNNTPEPIQNYGGGRLVHGPHGPHPPGFSQVEPVQNRRGIQFVHGPHPPGFSQSEPVQGPGQPGLNPNEPVNGYGYGRYAPSPLPRWQATPKRHEYFSGEYQYYPTPVREGIYSVATDANRLTSIFSEENPNACTIV